MGLETWKLVGSQFQFENNELRWCSLGALFFSSILNANDTSTPRSENSTDSFEEFVGAVARDISHFCSLFHPWCTCLVLKKVHASSFHASLTQEDAWRNSESLFKIYAHRFCWPNLLRSSWDDVLETVFLASYAYDKSLSLYIFMDIRKVTWLHEISDFYIHLIFKIISNA